MTQKHLWYNIYRYIAITFDKLSIKKYILNYKVFNNTVASVKGSLKSNKAAWVNAANAKNKVVEKLAELKLGGKIEELKKKIQLTRNKANLVS